MGSLIDLILFLFLNQIMEAEAISEASSNFIRVLFRSAELEFSTLFLPLRRDQPSSILGNSEGSRLASENCCLWERFIAVGNFLNMSLTEIDDMFSSKRFSCISNKELASLIVAVFDESEKRSLMLRKISRES